MLRRGPIAPNNFQSLFFFFATASSREKQLSSFSTDNKNKALSRVAPAVKSKDTSEQQEILHLQDLLLSSYWFLTACQSHPKNIYLQIAISIHYQQRL